MIKFIGKRAGKTLYGLGLSRGNCELLLQGKPILIDLDVMGGADPLPDHRGVLLLLGGETETAVADDLQRRGLTSEIEIRRQDGLETPPPPHPLAQPKEGQGNVASPKLLGYNVSNWAPAPGAPATCVSLRLKLDVGNIILRLETPQAVDELIQLLLRHKRSVWTEAP